MFYQNLFSPQVKRSSIISNKHSIYKLPHKWPNNYQENLEISQNDSLVPSPPAKIKILLKLTKNSWKAEIKLFYRSLSKESMEIAQMSASTPPTKSPVKVVKPSAGKAQLLHHFKRSLWPKWQGENYPRPSQISMMMPSTKVVNG